MKRRRSDLYEFRGRWRDQVFGDHHISHAAFKVAYLLASFVTMDRTMDTYLDTGRVEIFPSHDTLAHQARVASDTVYRAVNQLVDRGHLERGKRGNQFSGSNTYLLVIRQAARAGARS